MGDDLSDMLTHVYESMEGSEVAEEYSERHGIKSAAVLTVYTDEMASLITRSASTASRPIRHGHGPLLAACTPPSPRTCPTCSVPPMSSWVELRGMWPCSARTQAWRK